MGRIKVLAGGILKVSILTLAGSCVAAVSASPSLSAPQSGHDALFSPDPVFARNNVSSEELERIPAARNFSDFLTLQPGVKSARSLDDFGGGTITGLQVNALDPSLTGGGYHTGLFTSHFRPIEFADGNGVIKFFATENIGYINLDNSNPTVDNNHFATIPQKVFGGTGALTFGERNEFYVGTRLSAAFAYNRADLKNDFTDAGCDSRNLDRQFCAYDASVFVGSKTFGKLTLGLGETAYAGIGGIDLGGTDFAANYMPTYKFGYHEVWGLGVTYGQVASYTQGVERGTGVRYDSPSIAGFVVSSSWGQANHTGAPDDANGYWDVALRYAGEFGAFRVAAGAGYQNYGREGGNDRRESNATFGGSVQHVPTGLFLSGSTTNLFRSSSSGLGKGDTDQASGYYVKAGISQNFFGIGRTAVFGEYGETVNGADFGGNYFWEASKTTNSGFGVIQDIDAAALSLYATYNHATAEISGTSGEPLNAYIIGARIKF